MKTQLLLLAALSAPLPAIADYYIYRQVDGRIVIANQTPPANAEIVKRYNWRDATDAEIAATEKANRVIASQNLDRDRIAATNKLASAIAEQNARNAGTRIEINDASASVSSSSITVAPRRRHR
jgi:hypothetical protein